MVARAASPVINGPLTVHLRSDRMTLRIAKAPQFYLAGTMDAAAVTQLHAWLQSGRLSAGTDVYLDASGSDLAAGMAVGRLLREAGFNTHLGAWRSGHAAAPAAACVDACAYAWAGGVTRWSPSGRDRIGLHEAALPDAPAADGAPTPQARRDYLQAMGVLPAALAKVQSAPVDGMVWWQADLLATWQVANNGRLPLTASYAQDAGVPTLVLSQTVRSDLNRISLRCAAGHVELTARYAVGYVRAEPLARRAMYAWFERDQQPGEDHHGARPVADGDALVFTRELPFSALDATLRSDSLAARIEVAGSPVKLGFWLSPSMVQKQTQPFYAACQAMQPGYVPPAPVATQTRPSWWRRLLHRI